MVGNFQGFKVCRYLFVRCDNEPAPWTRFTSFFFLSGGFLFFFPVLYLFVHVYTVTDSVSAKYVFLKSLIRLEMG